MCLMAADENVSNSVYFLPFVLLVMVLYISHFQQERPIGSVCELLCLGPQYKDNENTMAGF